MESVFSYVMLADGILQIKDTEGNCATLVSGETGAILFDTMIGVGDLKSFVSGFSDLPLLVINSHGHLDHIGGNYQFDTVYMHPADRPLLPVQCRDIDSCSPEVQKKLSDCRKSLKREDNLKDLQVGTVFDLGNLHAKVVGLPGHTAGSIGLLLEEKRILLAGDACTPQMCLFMAGAQSLEVYHKTLKTLQGMEFDFFILGHFQKLFPKSLLWKLEECVYLPQTKKGHFFQYGLLPNYTGEVYFLEYKNPDVDEMICIIL